jgi:hypothetical protein
MALSLLWCQWVIFGSVMLYDFPVQVDFMSAASHDREPFSITLQPFIPSPKPSNELVASREDETLPITASRIQY